MIHIETIRYFLISLIITDHYLSVISQKTLLANKLLFKNAFKMYKMLIVINLYLSKIMIIYDDYDYDVKSFLAVLFHPKSISGF